MNREQEALLNKYANEGKVSKDYTFWVRHKHTLVVSPIRGDMLSGFLDEKTYELYEDNPEKPVEDANPANAKPIKKK